MNKKSLEISTLEAECKLCKLAIEAIDAFVLGTSKPELAKTMQSWDIEDLIAFLKATIYPYIMTSSKKQIVAYATVKLRVDKEQVV